MIKYRLNYNNEIEELEVVKETERQIVYLQHSVYDKKVREIKESKKSKWQNWFDTKEEAINFVIDFQENYIKSMKYRIEEAENIIKTVKSL